MPLVCDFSHSFVNYMLNAGKIAIQDDCLYLLNFDSDDLVKQTLASKHKLFRIYDRAAFWLRHVPGVRAFSLCNSLALGSFHEESDVDVFLVLDSKSFFTTRLLIIGLFEILRLRPKLCLSFLVNEKRLDLNSVRLNNDVYLNNWMQSLKFETSSIELVNEFCNLNSLNTMQRQLIKTNFVFRALPSLFESACRNFQLRRARKKSQELTDNSGIVIEDGFLKFHHNDIRPKFNRYYHLEYGEFLRGNRVKTYPQSLQAELK